MQDPQHIVTRSGYNPVDLRIDLVSLRLEMKGKVKKEDESPSELIDPAHSRWRVDFSYQVSTGYRQAIDAVFE